MIPTLDELTNYVGSAFFAAVAADDSMIRNKGQLHHGRSSRFVEGLAELLRGHYPSGSGVRVFSKGFPGNKALIKQRELLFDINVCQVDVGAQGYNWKLFPYVKRPLLQIESELAEKRREALLDFNKLVLGAGEVKLFVGPHLKNDIAFLQTLSAPAACCSGAVFVALVPHPKRWGGSGATVDMYEFGTGQWTQRSSVPPPA